MLSHADILLAICDGEADDVGVGAARIIAEAKTKSIPVIWVDAANPHSIQYCDSNGKCRPFADAQVAKLQLHILLPPDLLVTVEADTLELKQSNSGRNTYFSFQMHKKSM